MIMEELPLGALRVRGWSRGCGLCWEGAKIVLFVTGKCPLYESCPYCTISEWRRDKDLVLVDENPVSSDEDVIREAELVSALGAGITGGEPSLVVDKVAHYVQILKDRFGDSFHTHMYTNAVGIDERSLSILRDAGLDEIRFHSWDRRIWERMVLALDEGFTVGAEMPSIPREPWVSKLKELASYLDRIGASFINLNELEFTPSNRNRLLKMGLRPKTDSEVAVQGSAEAAREVLEFVERETGIMGYYCPALQKEYQVRMRWARRAKNVAKEYEEPTDEGTLIYGEIEGPEEALLYLSTKYGGVISGGKLLIDPYTFQDIAKEVREFGLDGRLVEVMPTDDRKVLQIFPLDFILREMRRSEGD
ncbi:MAG: radical SAM protein [Candidatus Korarchaeota archaeon]|nr:radical SAM protein [Candidatus Korarchaeota archaeon]